MLKCQQLNLTKYMIQCFEGNMECIIFKLNKKSIKILENIDNFEKLEISLTINVIKIVNIESYNKSLVIDKKSKFKLRLSGNKLDELYLNRKYNNYYYSKIFYENWFIFGEIRYGKLFLTIGLLQAPHSISLLQIKYKIKCDQFWRYQEIHNCCSEKYVYNINQDSDYHVSPQNLENYFRLKMGKLNKSICLNVEITILNVFTRHENRWGDLWKSKATDDGINQSEWSHFGIVH